MLESLTPKEFKKFKLPSVSKILVTVFGDAEFKSIPEQVLEFAKQRGTAVHECIEKYIVDDGNLDIELEYQIYIDYFKDWMEEYKPDFMGLSEIRIVSDLGFKGIIDSVMTIDGKVVLCDWKTSSKLDVAKASLQLSLYALAVEEKGLKVDELRILSLTKNGYKYIEVPLELDVARALLKLYDFKIRVLKKEEVDDEQDLPN